MQSTQAPVAIVTGAAQGIGIVIARTLSREGYTVAILDLQEDAATRVAESIARETGGRCGAYGVDVTNVGQVTAAVERIAATLGPIDVLVNNAAIFTTLNRKPFETIPAEEWDAVMKVNVGGPFNMAKAVVPGMKDRRHGRIVNISSNTVQLGRPGFLHYVTSKSALIGMTRSMARELGTDGITVNAIMPTLVKTEITAETIPSQVFDDLANAQCIPRAGRPEDVAETIAFLVSDKAEFITGQTVAVDGGAIFR